MKARALIGVALLALCLNAGAAQSQQQPQQAPQIEPKQKADGSTKAKQNASDEKEGASNSSTRAPLIASNASKPKADAKRENRDQDGTEFWPPFFGYKLKITDSLIAIFTLFVFCATAALYCATGGLVSSAERTADIALAAELPILNVIGGSVNGKIRVSFQNVGRTPAIITADCLVTEISKTLNDSPRYPLRHRKNLDFGYVMKSDDGYYNVERPNSSSDKESNSVLVGENIQWLYGYVEYLDFMKTKRRDGFCVGFILDVINSSEKWVQGGPAAYTYSQEASDAKDDGNQPRPAPPGPN